MTKKLRPVTAKYLRQRDFIITQRDRLDKSAVKYAAGAQCIS